MSPDRKYPYIELHERSNPDEANTEYQGGPADEPNNDGNTLVQPNTDGYALRRFYLRAIVGIVTPIVVTLFYAYISWNHLYGPSADPENPINIGPGSSRFVFYGWFVVGTIGINLSSYGLQGAEAAMLMDRRWGADNALQLLMHCDTSWSGPGGWMKIVRKWSHLVGLGRKERSHPSRLWMLLACLTAMVFVAFPLSGLTMELSDGYKIIEGYHPITTGRDYWTLNQRNNMEFGEMVASFWISGTSAKLPGLGIAYTEKGIDRRNIPFLSEVPTTLPGNVEKDFPDLFLPSQGMTPFRGETWGLRMRYGCAVVSNRSEFSILDQHIRAFNQTELDRYLKYSYQENFNSTYGKEANEWAWYNDNSSVISMSNWDSARAYRNESSLDSAKIPTFVQLGLSDFPKEIQLSGVPGHKQYRYHDRQLMRFDSRSYNKEHVMELAMFQYLGDIPSSRPDLLEKYQSIEGLDDVYTVSNDLYYWEPMKMSAIGIRCTSQSQVGLATVDPVTSSFTDFKPSDSHHPKFLGSHPNEEANYGVWPLSFGPMFTLTNAFAEVPTIRIKDAGEAGAEKRKTFITSGRKGKAVPHYPPFDQSMLKRSIESLYALYGRSLMYDKAIDIDETVFQNFFPNGSIYTLDSRKAEVEEGAEGLGIKGVDSMYFHAFENLNVTGTHQKRVLVRGTLGWQVIMALFIIWCACSVALVSMYGFRRRWSETLDSYSMFRFGADFGDEIQKKRDFSDTKDYEQCPSLKEIPGLVGDSRPESNPGKISLIWRGDYRPGFKTKTFAA
ncbi:hypothetical protein BJ508DRAFT_419911 [Ascobolus immersus RN42]|uniref:Uncharacterized protein n=1 Tax=Ascobolus immersus RN42 TaxID=1160509 RepID=A0A3N4HE21_ASCIM|nr:hypothetical protein BJ508DRAFT_419911 [Ascobolus immersus RN42]